SLNAQQQLSILIEYIRSHGMDTSKRQDIITMARELAWQHPKDAEVVGIYGDILILNGEPEAGVEQYKKSLNLDPSRFPVWQNLLNQYADMQQADSLVYYASKALKLFPNQVTVHYLKAIGHY